MFENTILPIEIIQKIFLYVCSPTANLVKKSRPFQHTFPFMALRQDENIFPFLTKTRMDYLRIYRKIQVNRFENISGQSYDNYRRFHEYSNFDDSIEDMDHDPCVEEESDGDMIDRHLLTFILEERHLYKLNQSTITCVYEQYLQNPKQFQLHPWLFKTKFIQGCQCDLPHLTHEVDDDISTYHKINIINDRIKDMNVINQYENYRL